jgi:threonine synthase
MDIQISSNFERLLFDILNHDDKKVKFLMSNLISKGSFILSKEEIDCVKKDFSAAKISDLETLEIIKEFESKYNFILDPHTATAVGASNKIKNDCETIVLGTAHPYKFLETIKKATGKVVKPPKQFSNILDKKEKYDILNNQVFDVKKYILEKAV